MMGISVRMAERERRTLYRKDRRATLLTFKGNEKYLERTIAGVHCSINLPAFLYET